MDSLVARSLVTVHPNPGPMRHRTPEAKAARMELRRSRRNEKREERESMRREAEDRERMRREKELVVVAWNVQGMSMAEMTKRKARAVAEIARKSEWDVVLLSEVRARKDGVVWMGEEEQRVVVIHSERAGVMLRGSVLKEWIDGGMLKKVDERHVSIKVRGLVLTATYMPVSVRGNEREVEAEWEVLG